MWTWNATIAHPRRPATRLLYTAVRHGRADVKSATDIAARAVCMGVISFRARFEGVRFDNDPGATEQAAGMIGGITNWLRNAGLMDSLIEPERDLMQLPPNQWDRPILVAIEIGRA